MKSLGDYLRSSGKYLLVGAGTAGAVILAPPFFSATQPDIKPSSGIEERLNQMPKPKRLMDYVPDSVAHAQSNTGGASPSTIERVTIDEYYNRAIPSNEIAPGVRIGQYRQPPINATGFGLIENEWLTFYNHGVNQLYDALREINGKPISNGALFDSQKIIEFIGKEGPKFRAVGFYGNFMLIDYADRSKKVVIPLAPEVIDKIKKLVPS